MARGPIRFAIGMFLGLVLAGAPAAAQDAEAIATTVSALGETFPAGEAAGFAEALAAAPAGVTGDTFGHLLYTRRQFDKAAWFFGNEAARDPSDPASLNNFAALLTEVYRDAPDDTPEAWLPAALSAAEGAVALDRTEAAYRNTLGNVALALGDAKTAAQAFTLASAFSPREPLYWANLARALMAMGEDKAAAIALSQAHMLDPNGPALLAAVGNASPATRSEYQGILGKACEVNFRCQEICPGGIVGAIMSVSCEIENSSAQMACEAGEPYPTSYNCAEEFPEYGIMIPGLNAGFSIALPGFTAHVKVNGDGSVDIRIEAGPSLGPLSGYLRGDGHYSPSNGASFDNLGGGVRVNILPGPSEAGSLASSLGHPHAHIEGEMVGDDPAAVNLETFNAGLLSF